MGRTGKEAYTQEYSVITKAWQRFVGLSGLENSTSLLIDFRIADYKSKTPEESWDLNSVPNEPHTFRDNITGKRKGFKVKAMRVGAHYWKVGINIKSTM